MKIEIEFTSSYHATVTIEGQTNAIKVVPWGWEVEGASENTLGGMVMSVLLDVVPGILQGWASANEHDDGCGMWTALSEEAADAVYEAIDR